MIIKIVERVSQQPRGDRDTQLHPCSKFQVILSNSSHDVVIATYDQWDPNWTTISGDRESYHEKALDKAKELSDALGGIKIRDVDETRVEAELDEIDEKIQALMRRKSDLLRRANKAVK